MSKMTITANGAELYLERTFAAPRDKVWAAFTDCEHLKHWWGPNGWDLTHCTMDFREGGRWHYCMSGKDENGDGYGHRCRVQFGNGGIHPDRCGYGRRQRTQRRERPWHPQVHGQPHEQPHGQQSPGQ